MGVNWVMRDCLREVWSGRVENWRGRWVGGGRGRGFAIEDAACERFVVGARGRTGAGTGVASWAVESQTKSWLRLVLSRKRTRAEAVAG